MNEFSSFSPEHRSEGSAETEKAETSSKELGIKKEESDFDAIFQKMNRAEGKLCYAGTEREGTERGELFRENKSVGENPEMTDKVRSIIKDSHEEAKEVSFSATEGKLNGRYFTDHKEAHVEMVAEKAREAGEAISAAVRDGGFKGEKDENRIAFSKKIDYAVLEGAGLSHDTGMNGKGYKIIENEKGYTAEKLNENNFDEIRQNHSLNSAIHVLENRDKYRDAGYSDEQIDKIAVECMAHSKRSSGVTDLNSKEAWSACFDRMDTAVEAYNKEHEGKEISFDRERLERIRNHWGKS